MRKLSLENREMQDILVHQVIHMDQGVSYTPEYIATRKMRHYPSRTAQVIRSVYMGELPANQYGADMVFAPILSGQGERWQNFGEDPNGYILTVMLGRELFYKKGFYVEEIDTLKNTIEKNGGLFPQEMKKTDQWKKALPINTNSHIGLLLDEATCIYAAESRNKIGTFLRKKEIEISVFGPYFTGFDYLANGCIDEGIEIINQLLENWTAQGITKMITLTGQSQYIFEILLPYLGIETDIEFISILDLTEGFAAENAYIYGGSFFTRYLRKDEKLNQLLPNTEEERLLCAPEFLPEVHADHRRNIVGIWTPPLCAEYHAINGKKDLEEKIYAESLATIEETSFGTLLVCDPFACEALRSHGYPKKKMLYYLDILQ